MISYTGRCVIAFVEVLKIHLITWGMVTKPKYHGGLGLRAMIELNSAFMDEAALTV